MSLNIKLLLDKRRSKKDGSFPLVMRILHHRKSINVPLGYSLLEKDWNDQAEKIKPSSNISDNVTRINNYIHKQRTKAYDLFAKLQDEDRLIEYSLTDIKKLLLNKASDRDDNVFNFIDEQIESLIQAKKQGNAAVYKTLRNKLRSFVGHEKLTFLQINYKFLKKLETVHLASGAKIGSLSVYLRTLSAVYNKAIKSGIVDKDHYPFHDYKIKHSKPVRKAMRQEDFATFAQHQFDVGSPLDRAKKLFMASFYLRGMNWMDMAYLTPSNIQGDFERISYVRQKTGEPFNIKINPNLKVIMLEFLGEGYQSSDYIFPILKETRGSSNEAMVIRNKRQRLNKRLKEIAVALGIDTFTIYTARHTYATTAKRKGVPTAVIQEGLGHSTESMTQTYLDSFENKVVDDYDDLIMEDL